MTDLVAPPEVSNSAIVTTTNSAYPQSLTRFAPSPIRLTIILTLHRSAHYFDSVEGFGEWVIYISTAADGHLRQYRRKDKKIFGIIVKKIRSVLHG